LFRVIISLYAQVSKAVIEYGGLELGLAYNGNARNPKQWSYPMQIPKIRTIVLAVMLTCFQIGCTAPVEAEDASQPAEPAVEAPVLASTPLLAATTVPGQTSTPDDTERDVQGWAVLAGKEDYSDVGMSELDSGFINFYRMRATLSYLGWQDDHILEIRDDLTVPSLDDALSWLAENADENDVVFLYVAGHGEYMRQVLQFDKNVPPAWAKIKSSRRALVLDSCRAGAYIAPLEGAEGSFVAIGGVGAGELGWAGLWEEGLPILGTVFTHYFTDALVNPAADLDEDGAVSVTEAASLAEQQQREYMHTVVWEIPEYAEVFDNVDDPENPHVPVIDHLEEPVYFDLDWYVENQE
jgi:hypothetical protein